MDQASREVSSRIRTLPRAVLVDLDDTIVDGSAVVDCWEVACQCCPAGVDSAAILAEILRLREWYWSDPARHREGRLDLSAARRHIAEMALDNIGCEVPDLGRTIAEQYDRCRDDRITLFPGALDVLSWMRGCGSQLALLTNGGAQSQREKIARFQLEPLFDLILVEGELGFGKPDERIYRRALTELAASPADAWMIGDNLEWDVGQPQKLGLAGIWVDRTGAGVPAGSTIRPDLVVRSFTEIRAHVSS